MAFKRFGNVRFFKMSAPVNTMMETIKCKNCKHFYSSDMDVCPNCGTVAVTPIRETSNSSSVPHRGVGVIITTLLSIVSILAVWFGVYKVLNLDADGNKNSTHTASRTSAAASAIKDDAGDTFGLNETAVFENLKFTAIEIKEYDGTKHVKPQSGKTFVGIKFIIENISNEEQYVSSLMLFTAYADDIKCDFSLNANVAFDEGTLDGEIAAGKKLMGWYALEVPENWSKIDLEVKSEWLSGSSAMFVFSK